MKAIAVNGTSDSGKTTVCEGLIRGLRQRGYTVGSVKEIHCQDFTIDVPGTDTARHREAGSQLVTARGFLETDILFQSKLPITEILSQYQQDYVILEGVTDCNAPRIITAHNLTEVEERMDCRTVAVTGVIANTCGSSVFGLPVFNALTESEALLDFVVERAFPPLPDFSKDCCGHCGFSCREMAGRIAHQQAVREDCLLWSQETELRIDGVSIAMVPFVQTILKRAVLAVAGELDGFKEKSKIEVRFNL